MRFYEIHEGQLKVKILYISAPVVIANVLKKLKTTIPVDFTIKSKCFNDSNVSAHHGIIPTNSDFDIEQLSGDEKLVYIKI